MTAVIIILSVTALIFIIFFITQGRQIRKICRQLAFVKEKKSNLKISFDTPFKEINELTVQLNEIIEKARKTERLSEQRENDLKATITNLSHDIRTPLTSLDGYFQLLLQAETDEEKERYTNIIQTRISALKDILEELFTYIKLQNIDYELPLEDVDLNRIVCESVFAFYEDFKAKGIEPQLDIAEKNIIINGNEEALRRTFCNIIKNALEHGAEDDKLNAAVSISLKELNGKAIFSCLNKTVNSEEIDITRVFDRFYKSDSARTQISTGLGLSIAKELTQRMNGSAEASVKDNVFEVRLTFVK